MNEEFAIQLRAVLDQSSLNHVKQQLAEFGKTVQENTSQAISPAVNAKTSMGISSDDVSKAKEYSAQIKYIEAQINDLTEKARLIDLGAEEGDILKIEAQIERLKNKLKTIGNGNNNGFTVIKKTTVQIRNDMKKAVKEVIRFGLALLGVRGIYGTIRKAMSTWLSQNEELQNKLNGAWYALGSLFAPVLEWIVNKFVYLVSLVDALAKSLGVAGVNMAKYGKAGAKASKQVAGFDEINNINKQSGGSGLGDFKLNDITGDALNKFKSIASLVAAIATGLAAWKIASTFMNALGLTESQCVGIGLAVAGITAYVLGFIDAWKNGLNWDNIRLMLLGLAAAATGLTIAFGPLAGAIALIVGGVGLIVLGFKEFIQTGTMTEKACAAIQLGFMAIGVAIALLGSPILGIITLIVGVLLPKIIQNKDKIMEVVNNIRDKIHNFVNVVLPNAFNIAMNKVTDLKTKLVNRFQGMIGIVKDKINAFKTWWQNLSLGSFKIKMPHFRVEGSLSWSWNGGIQLPHISVDWYKKGGVFSGPQVIGVGEYSNSSNNPEVVSPLSTLSDMIGNNQRTEELLEELISVVSSKEFRAYISQRDVGEASVKYINQQSRIMGGSIV